jgi:hypothetical protein
MDVRPRPTPRSKNRDSLLPTAKDVFSPPSAGDPLEILTDMGSAEVAVDPCTVGGVLARHSSHQSHAPGADERAKAYLH